MTNLNQTILVTGGAGYIGGHFVNLLRKQPGYKIEVVDNFCQTRKNIIKHPAINYHETDIRNKSGLLEVFKKVQPVIVVHFAALANVPDSVARPFEYYDNNVIGSINLLECMRAAGCNKIIFSSSAATYGEPDTELISEDHPQLPTNPYGYTKLVFENILKDYNKAYGINSVSLRYFVASGCDPALEVGKYHNPETQAIPCIVQTLLGQKEKFFVFGNDYPTPDGTGVRDYIHVNDLATAHLKAMEKLTSEPNFCERYNLGINKGFSVLELITEAEKITGKKLNYEIKPRRPGDPSRLVAGSTKAKAELNWQPQYTDIRQIIETDYNFFKSLTA